MNRRDFFTRVGGVALATPVVLKLSGCGDDGGSDSPDAATQVDAPPQTGCMVAIGTNHVGAEHSLDLPAADVTRGEEMTYNIRGASAHPHTIVVTAADFTMLQQGESVTITSSNDAAHTHEVTLTCTGL